MQTFPIPNPDPLREIVSMRTFEHRQENVFEAWSNPDHLKIWWGPNGFTNTIHEFDFRPGGHWKLTMHGPEKGNYENESVFRNIEIPNLIYWHRLTQPYFDVVVTFDAVAHDKTNIVFRMIFPDERQKSKVIKFVPQANEENFDRLENVLNAMP